MSRVLSYSPSIAMPRENDSWKDMSVLLIVFVLCPFAAFLLALTRAKSKPSYVIYALWGMIFAWHMNPTGSSRYDDLIGIIEFFNQTYLTFEEVVDQLVSVLTFSPDAPKEWYMAAMIWVTRCFSDNYHLFFVLCSIPWLFFELSSLHRITNDQKFRQSLICIVILLLFVVPRDIITLQNPRFTTGTWMAVYATLGYFYNKRKFTYTILILLTPLVHSAFWFYVMAFLGGLIMYNFPRLSLWLLYASIPFSFLSYDLLHSINFTTVPLPTTLNSWIERYMSEESYSKYVANEGASGFYWVSDLFNFLMKVAYLLIPIYIIKYKDLLSKKQHIWHLCGFFIFFYAVVSFIQFVPVLGERFFWVVRILGIFIWFKALYPRHNWVIWFIMFSCSWGLFRRYFYHGAIESSVPLGIFWEPLPLLINDML